MEFNYFLNKLCNYLINKGFNFIETRVDYKYPLRYVWIFPYNDKLEKAIRKSGIWTGEKYKFGSHNCQDFVRFCLLEVGCPESMANKDGPVYREQDECVIF